MDIVCIKPEYKGRRETVDREYEDRFEKDIVVYGNPGVSVYSKRDWIALLFRFTLDKGSMSKLKTDREKLAVLLTEWGVGFEIDERLGVNNIMCREGGAKIDGYSMFCTMFEFDAAGKFIKMGAWE